MKSVIYVLLNYLNSNMYDDTYYYIAKTMLLHIDELSNMTLENTASLCNCSYSTINRFCKKIGYLNFTSLRDILRGQKNNILPTTSQININILEPLIRVEEINEIYFLNVNKLIKQANRILLFGYGEFQYSALYYQKQMLTFKKFIEIHNIYIDNFDYTSLKSDDLIIIVTMNGEFLKPNPKRILDLKQNKILLTQIKDKVFLRQFNEYIICPDCLESLNKYILLKLYERLIENYKTNF